MWSPPLGGWSLRIGRFPEAKDGWFASPSTPKPWRESCWGRSQPLGPCKPKLNRPPTPAALAIAADIEGSVAQGEPVIDLGVYQRHIDQQNRRRR